MKIIVGDTSRFAIESYVHQAYERRSFMALGYFQINVAGVCYGVRDEQATMLGCSLQMVETIYSLRGKLQTPDFFAHEAPTDVLDLIDNAIYGEDPAETNDESRKAIDLLEFVYSSHAAMHFGDDEAFDDGSVLFYFSFPDMTRVISAFAAEDKDCKWTSICDVWLQTDEFL